MSDQTGGAGWHPDPQHPDQLRYWDGGQWTSDTRPAGPPPAGPEQGMPQPGGAPPGGPQYTGPQPGATPPGGPQYTGPPPGGGPQYGGPQPGMPQPGGQQYGAPSFGGPGYGPQAPKKKGKGLYAVLGVVALLVVIGIIAAVASSGDDKEEGGGKTTTTAGSAAADDEPPEAEGPSAADTRAEPAEPPDDDDAPSGQDVLPLGETGSTGDFDVTVNEVQDPYESTNEFEEPDAGERFVAVELTVANTSDESQIMSTLASMEMTDSDSRRWEVAFAGFDLPQIEGDVPANETRRGWVVFGVSDEASGLTLRVKGSFSATGSVFALD